MNRTEILEILKKLSSSKLEELIFLSEAPPEYLPHKNTPPIERAIAVLNWASERGEAGLSEIERILINMTNANIKFQEIPFVTVAMTNKEALDLNIKIQDESDDASLGMLKDFIRIASVPESQIQSFTENYRNKRQDWRPYIESSSSIQKIIKDIIVSINNNNDTQRKKGYKLPEITSVDYSEKCFSEDRGIRAKTWEDLKQSGCILIIDPISLLCEHISKCLSDAEVLSGENTSAVIISPNNPNLLEIDELIKNISGDKLYHVYRRFEEKFDQHCEIGIKSKQHLTRWCFSILPIVQEKKLKIARAEGWRNWQEKTQTEYSNVQSLIFSRSQS